jgi:hypothetical protein
VTGGGLTAAGPWRAARNGLLRPGRVGMAVFRGKLRQALATAVHQGQLTRPTGMPPWPWDHRRHTRGRRQWHVSIRERSPDGAGGLTDLARDSRGGPLANPRLGACVTGAVRCRSRRHREGPGPAPRGVMTWPLEACIRRDLRPVPVPGPRVVRA